LRIAGTDSLKDPQSEIRNPQSAAKKLG
jgi:hypothetical protein